MRLPSIGHPPHVLRLLSVAVALAGFAASSPAAVVPQPDRIVVLKSQRLLELVHDGEVLKSYPVALGGHPLGAKRRAGDGRTPEGFYVIDWRTEHTSYHLALHVSYPNPEDRRHAQKAGENPGDAIFIHGMPARFGHTDPVRFFTDWTNGCISVGNVAIEEIWATVPDGTPVEIRP
jgi:murein L,D-transpeptidase YafK